MSRKTVLLLSVTCLCGCNSFQHCDTACNTRSEDSAKTLFAWAVGPKEPADNEDDKKQDNDPRAKPLQSDRPDFTEASTTVGKGVLQFEGGYTFTRDHSDNTVTTSHTYPQALFRIGMFADWFELRIGQNIADNQSVGMTNERVAGPEDTYLGVKLALTEQKQVLPELAIILQTTVPTGEAELSANKTLPGVSLLYGWEIIKEKIDLGGSTQANKSVEDNGHSYLEVAQSLTMGYTLTEKLGAYTECYAFFPSGATSPAIKPQYYFDGGFTYKLTNNIQFDVNAGIGLNRYADDYFLGTGIVLRY